MITNRLSVKFRSGYSLIEVSIAIVVIAVLMVLSLAAIGTVRKRAENVRCTNNLRQIGGLLFAYGADNNGKLMARSSIDVPAPVGWPARLLKLGYLSDPQILFCPSYFPRNNAEAKHKPTEGNAADTYGMRTWVVPGLSFASENNQLHKPLSSIENPADFFLVADSLWTAEGWGSQGYGITPVKGGNGNQLVHLRHNKMANTLFADGHVAAMSGSYFLDLCKAGRQPEYAGGTAYSFSVTDDLTPLNTP